MADLLRSAIVVGNAYGMKVNHGPAIVPIEWIVEMQIAFDLNPPIVNLQFHGDLVKHIHEVSRYFIVRGLPVSDAGRNYLILKHYPDGVRQPVRSGYQSEENQDRSEGICDAY